MQSARVIVLATSLDPELLARIDERYGVVTPIGGENWTEHVDPELIEAIVIRSPFRLHKEQIALFPNLRIVVRAGSGIDHVDVDALARRRVTFQTCEGNATAVAELTFGLILTLYRKLTELSSSLARGEWRKSAPPGLELRGKTMVVIGFGRIGKRISEIARGFGMMVIAVEHDHRLSEKKIEACSLGVRLTTMVLPALTEADVVVLACPLTAQTRGLISADLVTKLKRTAVIVNVARGEIWDFGAVVSAIESGFIAGACVDVYDHEPPEPSPVFYHPQIIATPHIGAQTIEAQRRIAEHVWRALIDAFDGTIDCKEYNSTYNGA